MKFNMAEMNEGVVELAIHWFRWGRIPTEFRALSWPLGRPDIHSREDAYQWTPQAIDECLPKAQHCAVPSLSKGD